MKKLLFMMLAAAVLASCSSQKRVLYLQNLDTQAIDRRSEEHTSELQSQR